MRWLALSMSMHDRFDFVALLKDFARMIDLSGPAQIGDVDHAVDAFFEFHERAVGGHVANLAFDVAADREFLLDLVPRIRLRAGAGRAKSSVLPCLRRERPLRLPGPRVRISDGRMMRLVQDNSET